MKGHFIPHTKETKRKISLAKMGKMLSEETKKKMLGRIPWNKDKKMVKGYGYGIRKSLLGKCGPLSRHWKGGITEEQQKARNSLQYAIWRMEVLRKDNFTCRLCNKRGGKLVAHHLNSFANFPELRFSIDNGITLCRKCHYDNHYSNKKIGSK